MSDFEKFQREQRRQEAEAQRRHVAAETADIQADEDYEEGHARYRWFRQRGVRQFKRSVPIWHVTAGTWATMLLMAAWWGLLVLLIQTSFDAKLQELKGALSAVALAPALILALITWRIVGQRARNVLRTTVRVAPLLLVGICGVRAGLGKKEPAPTADATQAASAVSTSTPMAETKEQATTPRTHEPLDPTDLAALRVALSSDDPLRARAALDALDAEHDTVVHELERARRVPGKDGGLLAAVERMRALRALAPELSARAAAHADLWAGWAKESPGALFGLRFAPLSASTNDALSDRLLRGDAPTQKKAFDALSEELRGADATARGNALRALTPALVETPRGSVYAAWLNARLLEATAAKRAAKPRDQACAALGRAVFSADEGARALAAVALADLSEPCRAAGPVIVDGLRRARMAHSSATPDAALDAQALGEAFAALGFTGLSNYGRAFHLFTLEQMLAGGTIGLTSLGSVLDRFIERDFLLRVGATPPVLDHLQATQGLSRPEVIVGPCTAAELGVAVRELAPAASGRNCLKRVSGPLLDDTSLRVGPG